MSDSESKPLPYAEYFAGKRVTVMGLGLLGRGVGDAAYIAEAGAAEVIVTDLKSAEELADSIAKLENYKNVTFVLGEHRLEDFSDRDLILVAAGVPMDSPYLIRARELGIPLRQSAALFAELSGIPIIGVTGTRGKSTVSAMVHHVLEVTTGEPVIFGGNVRGVSNLQLLREVREGSLAVMELDSWQLQGWGWAKMSPQIAVFTNFMPDHMNYYNDDMDAYFADKANIFKYQEDSGALITIPEVFERAQAVPGLTIGSEVILADASVIPEDCLLAMPGEHNRTNAALAYETLKAISLSDEEIFAGLASFGGVEGRLQLLGTYDNVRVFNDNNSTTPAATIAALKALDLGNRNIVLIAGGTDKGLDLTAFTLAIAAHCKRLILLPGTGTERLLEALRTHTEGLVETLVVESLPAAVEEAKLVAENADIILFSPGFASFGLFKNEYERNDTFITSIKETYE